MKNLEKKTITQIEKEIKSKIELSAIARKEATMMLYSLKTSGRYKENKLYSKSSFKTYLEDVYSIREGTFNESVRAYRLFPEEACTYSVGLISSINRKCGAIQERKVIAEINAKAERLKTPIKRAQIAEVIMKYAKPAPEKKPNYKAKYEAELGRHQKTKELYREAVEELKAAKIQINRLKKTVLGLRAVAEAVRDYEETQVIA